MLASVLTLPQLATSCSTSLLLTVRTVGKILSTAEDHFQRTRALNFLSLRTAAVQLQYSAGNHEMCIRLFSGRVGLVMTVVDELPPGCLNWRHNNC